MDIKEDRTSAAARFIERQIDEGFWKPGDKLPTERDLVEKFGIARNTLRKSLDRLEQLGKITRHVGRGTFVGTSATDSSSGGLVAKILRASPAEVMDVRVMIEPQAAELSAASATTDDYREFDRCLSGGESARNVREFEDWDGRLHQRIVDAARNQLLSSIYAALNDVRQSDAWGQLKARSATPERRSIYIRQHREIVDALRARDPDRARDLVRMHLLVVKSSFGGF